MYTDFLAEQESGKRPNSGYCVLVGVGFHQKTRFGSIRAPAFGRPLYRLRAGVAQG